MRPRSHQKANDAPSPALVLRRRYVRLACGRRRDGFLRLPMGRRSRAMGTVWGSTDRPRVATLPTNGSRRWRISVCAPRREASPALASVFCRRSPASAGSPTRLAAPSSSRSATVRDAGSLVVAAGRPMGQPEPLEEGEGGPYRIGRPGVSRRRLHDEPPMEERAHDRVRVHAPNPIDIAPRHGCW